MGACWYVNQPLMQIHVVVMMFQALYTYICACVPFKGRNSRTVDKHVLPTPVFEVFIRLLHVKRQHTPTTRVINRLQHGKQNVYLDTIVFRMPMFVEIKSVWKIEIFLTCIIRKPLFFFFFFYFQWLSKGRFFCQRGSKLFTFTIQTGWMLDLNALVNLSKA